MKKITTLLLLMYVFFLSSCKTAAPPVIDRTVALHDTISIVRKDTVYLTDTLRLLSCIRDTVWCEESTHYVLRTLRDTFYVDKLSSLSTVRHACADSLVSSVSTQFNTHSDTIIFAAADTIRVRSPTHSVASRSIIQKIKDTAVGLLICLIGFCLLVYINRK